MKGLRKVSGRTLWDEIINIIIHNQPQIFNIGRKIANKNKNWQ
jgi:hypothetical protein